MNEWKMGIEKEEESHCQWPGNDASRTDRIGLLWVWYIYIFENMSGWLFINAQKIPL